MQSLINLGLRGIKSSFTLPQSEGWTELNLLSILGKGQDGLTFAVSIVCLRIFGIHGERSYSDICSDEDRWPRQLGKGDLRTREPVDRPISGMAATRQNYPRGWVRRVAGGPRSVAPQIGSAWHRGLWWEIRQSNVTSEYAIFINFSKIKL